MTGKDGIIASGPFLNYIEKAPAANMLEAIRASTEAFNRVLQNVPAGKQQFAYAPGKWTLAELLQHLIDAERVFTYRALRMARLDPTPLAGFDEEQWAAAANKNKRPWNDLLAEFRAVRTASEMLFASFTEEQLLFQGTSNDRPLNALALGFILAGHVQHHLGIITGKYL